MVNAEIEGIPQLLQKFQDMAMSSLEAQKNGLNLAADELTREIKQTKKLTDDTGDLRESITKSDVKSSKYGKYIWVGDVNAKTDYSWFVEYGRSGGPNGYVAPTHFLKGTMLENNGQLKEIMINELKRGLNL